MIIKIAKFILYPKEDPIGYAVGFDIELPNGRKFYKDVIVELSEINDLNKDDDIIDLAWQKVSDEIDQRKNKLLEKSDFLGKEWTPKNKRNKEENKEENKDNIVDTIEE